MENSGEIFKEPKYLPAKWFYFTVGIVASAAVFYTADSVKKDARLDALEHVVPAITPAVFEEMNRRSEKRDMMLTRIADNFDTMASDIGDIKFQIGEIKGRMRIK